MNAVCEWSAGNRFGIKIGSTGARVEVFTHLGFKVGWSQRAHDLDLGFNAQINQRSILWFDTLLPERDEWSQSIAG